MEFKGTKGEWMVNENAIICNKINIAVILLKNFALNADGTMSKDKEMEANAKLIAAAPDLLEALEPFSAFPDEDFIEEESEEFFTLTVQVKHIIAAKQAIKKALL